jgi:hypothetical protein
MAIKRLPLGASSCGRCGSMTSLGDLLGAGFHRARLKRTHGHNIQAAHFFEGGRELLCDSLPTRNLDLRKGVVGAFQPEKNLGILSPRDPEENDAAGLEFFMWACGH